MSYPKSYKIKKYEAEKSPQTQKKRTKKRTKKKKGTQNGKTDSKKNLKLSLCIFLNEETNNFFFSEEKSRHKQIEIRAYTIHKKNKKRSKKTVCFFYTLLCFRCTTKN